MKIMCFFNENCEVYIVFLFWFVNWFEYLLKRMVEKFLMNFENLNLVLVFIIYN